MVDAVISFFQESVRNPQLITFFLAMLPITELRVALPWGMTFGGLEWYSAYFWSVAGNYVIALFILLFLEPVSRWLRQWKLWDRFFSWLFARTRRKGKLIETFEFWGLVLFVGIPLPVTGAWTGCVAAFIFGLVYRKSVFAILLGLILSATVVTILTTTGKLLIMM